MIQKRYVAGFMFANNLSQVVLIHKRRPAWQCGLWNAIGGSIEDGETPDQAMSREAREETGVENLRWRMFCEHTIERDGVKSIVHFYWATIADFRPFQSVMTDETVALWTVSRVLECDRQLISNIPWLVQMALRSMLPETTCIYRIQEFP